MIVLLLFVLLSFGTMTFSASTTALLEMFPSRIRYTAMSFPYNLSSAWFGGFLPATAFSIVAATGNVYSGLYYPIGVAVAAAILSLLFARETRGTDISGPDPVRALTPDATAERAMSLTYFMPTRVVWGPGSLDGVGPATHGLGCRNVLVVTDPVIGKQAFFARVLDSLRAAGLETALFDACGIDARLAHIDEQAARCRAERIDGIVCVGGGSVMCTGKGVAIVAANGTTLRDHLGAGNFDRPALPMVMVPTTAGSGSEVSQFTIVKDEERHLKLLAGGPLSFPAVAVLDPAVLRRCRGARRSCPRSTR